MDFTDLIKVKFKASSDNLRALSDNSVAIHDLSTASNVIIDHYAKGGTIYVIGNGGSAADAQHIVAEFISRLSKNRDPIRAVSLTTDTSILTAIGNDYGYEHVFERQVLGTMKENDILLAISTSGNSKNIQKALVAAKKIHATSVLLAGGSGGECRALADFVILANGRNTAEIQESHIVIYHALCYLIEVGLVEKGLCHYN